MPPDRPVSGPGRATRRTFGLVFALAALALVAVPSLTKAQDPATPPPAPAAAPPIPPPLPVPRLSGQITLDGDLSEAAWASAAVVDQFFETFPADNAEPAVKTLAYLTYDDRYFYIGIHAFDPDPAAIRAPYVERDAVIGTDDNVAVFLDTRNDRRSALELRVNPRGIQGDAHLRRRHRHRGLLPRLLLRHRRQVHQRRLDGRVPHPLLVAALPQAGRGASGGSWSGATTRAISATPTTAAPSRAAATAGSATRASSPASRPALGRALRGGALRHRPARRRARGRPRRPAGQHHQRLRLRR